MTEGQMSPFERVVEMCKQDPACEVYLMRNGKNCIGFLKDGVLYYAQIKEVNLDADG